MFAVRCSILTLAVLLAGCSAYGAASGRVVLQDGNSRVSVSINEQDRALIKQYYAAHERGRRLPPGLAKRRGALPPGLAKRDRLPPGLEYRALPAGLERRLAPLPEGYIRVRIGTDIVLLEQRTRVVIDVVQDVRT